MNLNKFLVMKSLMIQMVKNLPSMQETQVLSLDWEDPLEEEMATHSNILAWRIPMDRGTWRATVHGITESDMTERLTLSTFLKSLLFTENPDILLSLLRHERRVSLT